MKESLKVKFTFYLSPSTVQHKTLAGSKLLGGAADHTNNIVHY